MTFKKLLSGCLCTAMLFGTFTATTYAEETPTENSWNYSVVDESVTDLYADFPVQIDKNVHKDMSLDIHFRYLKNLSSQNEASLEIRDLSDNSVKASFDFSAEEITFVWENAENNKTFLVEITENVNGVTDSYTGYISTKYVPTNFPVNMTLGNVEYLGNSGETFEQIALKKVGVNPVCNHAEDEECTDSCSIASVLTIVKPDELDTFYSELDSDSFYEIQVMANDSGHTDVFRGFISTYTNGEELGVFTPGYEFSNNSDYGISVANYGIEPASARAYRGIAWEDVEEYFNDNGTYEYYMYENVLFSSLTQSNDVIIEWTVPETGYYTFETIGNLDTEIYEFTVTDGVPESIGDIISDGGTGENASNTFGAMEGVVKYFFVNKENGSSGAWAFRIKRNDYSNKDSISGYRDEVQTAYDNGIFSPVTNEKCGIWYSGDVNIFAYNVTKGIGGYRFKDVSTTLTMKVYSVSGRVGGFDQLWLEASYSVDPTISDTHTRTEEFDFTAGIHYIDIMQKDALLSKPDDSSYSEPIEKYDFEFFDPKRKDIYDMNIYAQNGYNDSPVFPVQISSFPYTNNERTLHRADSDWFAFTTGSEVGDFNAKLYEVSEKQYQYNIYLYEEVELYEPKEGEVWEPEWYPPTSVGNMSTIKSDDGNYQELNYYDLLPNHTYFIEIERDSSSEYSSIYPYTLEANIDLANPTAILEENVTITHIRGESLTDLSVIYATVMDKLSCTKYGLQISDREAEDDVKLFYNNSELTATLINGLSAGTYAITVKYCDVEATGGTVSLVVSEPENPTAVLSGNVEFTHTIGDNVMNLNGFYDEILTKLTCLRYNEIVSDEEALSDIKLYCNGIELTAAMVNDLSAGTYVLTLKYCDVDATGGTISLIVIEAETDDIQEINTVFRISVDEPYIDWAGTVKMIVDARLAREEAAPSTMGIWELVDAIMLDDWEQRASLTQVKTAANYLYNGNISGNLFRSSSSTSTTTLKETVYNNIESGKPLIIQLASSADITDMSLARYIVITGVNMTNNTYKIIDPFLNYDNVWISCDIIHNGGYNGDDLLKFSGRILETGN